MSLLMEALKKAERAKQGKTVQNSEQSGQPGGAEATSNPVTAPSTGPSLPPRKETAGHVEATGASDFPLITPDLLPPPIEDKNTAPARIEPTISALELTLDEAPPLRGAPVSPAPMVATLSPNSLPKGESDEVSLRELHANVEPDARPQPTANHVEAPNKTPPQDVRKITAAQQKAKTVFSAKQSARSKVRLLTGAAMAVVLGMAGYGVYYWQIMSTGSMTPPASPPQPTNAATPAIPVDAGAPQQQGAPVASTQNPIGKPVLSPVEACPEPCQRGPAPATAQASPPAASPVRAEARNGSEPFKENPAIRIRQSAATIQLNPTLGKAYQSFLSGDTGKAQQLYQKVLQQEPNNRDALLGMAAIALKHKQPDQATAYYSKLLELDPADPEALAALIGLRGQSDPIQSESRLEKDLAQNPQADAAHFALGNLYAQQSRWAEAQQSYFRAYSIAPGNADYAFNLAVSLDHLNQGKLALDYYQRALAQPGPANFDKSSVQTRIKELTMLVEK